MTLLLTPDSEKRIKTADKPKNNYIDRDVTDILKGAAIILMFILHFFTLPDLLAQSNPNVYPEVLNKVFNPVCNMCVAVFAFITGYCYVFTKKKTLKYSLKKATDLWVNYFVFFLLLLIPAVILGCWNGSAESFLAESLALNRPTMTFCWYVVFYVICILLLPLYHRAAKKHLLTAVVIGYLLPVGAQAVFQDLLHIDNAVVADILYHFFTWVPCIVAGYLCAEFELFSLCFDRLFKNAIRLKALRYIVFILLILLSLAGRYFLPDIRFNISVFTVSLSMDIIYAPLFVYGSVNIVYLIPWRKIWAPLALLGKYSMGMWFFHCIFFNSCKEYTQPILYFPKNPLLILLWGIMICLAASFAVTKAAAPILKLKNKLLFKNI